jgi:hypothetical protein
MMHHSHISHSEGDCCILLFAIVVLSPCNKLAKWIVIYNLFGGYKM